MEKDNQAILGTAPIPRLLVKLSISNVISMLVGSLYILKTIANDTIICNAVAKRRETFGFVFSMYSDPAADAAAAVRQPFQIIFYII